MYICRGRERCIRIYVSMYTYVILIIGALPNFLPPFGPSRTLELGGLRPTQRQRRGAAVAGAGAAAARAGGGAGGHFGGCSLLTVVPSLARTTPQAGLTVDDIPCYQNS